MQLNEIAERMIQPVNRLRLRQGKVIAVDTVNNDIDVQVAGSTTTVSNVKHFQSLSPVVNEQVWLLTDGFDMVAIGKIGATSGGGGGATNLDGLTDVAITSVADGHVLQYSGSGSEWRNKTLANATIVTTANVNQQVDGRKEFSDLVVQAAGMTFEDGSTGTNLAGPITGGGGTLFLPNANGTLAHLLSGSLQLNASDSGVDFEGSTVNSIKTSLKVVNPTANRTIRLPDATGTVALTSDLSGYVASTLVDAKGDLIVGTADNTVARQIVGANGTILYADSTQSTGVKWATPPALPIPGVNDYIGVRNFLNTTANTTFAFAAGTINTRYAIPIFIAQEMNVDRIACEVTLASASSSIRLGIYDSNSNGIPSSLVIDAGTISSTTTGIKEITIASTALSAGHYWLTMASQSTGTPTVRAATVGNHHTPFVFSGTLTGVTRPYFTTILPNTITSTAGGTTGAFPATWGSTVNIANNASVIDMVLRRA